MSESKVKKSALSFPVMFEKVKELQDNGCDVMFCGMCKRAKATLDRAGVTELVGEDNYYISADQAFVRIMEKA